MTVGMAFPTAWLRRGLAHTLPFWLMMLLATMFSLPAFASETSAAAGEAPAAETAACTVQTLSVSASRASDDSNGPPATEWRAGGAATLPPGWEPVTLPDNWNERWPGYTGSVWYRIDWQRQCDTRALPSNATAPSAAIGLTLESIVMAGEVYVNDALIWRDAQLTEPLSRSWNMPRNWRLPDAILQDGVNTLWVRVVGVAQQTPGLGAVYLGDAPAMQAKQEDLWWRNRTLYSVNLIVSCVLGGLFFCIWVVRREQTTYGWYALMSLFWVLFISNVLLTDPWPFSSTLALARGNTIALVLYIVCFCHFTWRFGEQSMPRLQRALWILAAALVAMTATVPDAAVGTAQLTGVLISAAIFLANCLQFPVYAWRTRRPEHLMLAACLLVFFAVSLHDLLLMLKLIDTGVYYTPYSSVVITLCLSAILGLRHACNVRQIERFNQELADGIFQARQSLTETLAREHALAMANTRLHERLQIAHDLHDGLGGSLVRMMAMVEQADRPLHGQQFLSMLKLLRDDLRQTIDSGSSAGITVPATPQEWGAPLRHRYVQLFDELNLDSSWQFPPAWRSPPNPLQCLALTRLVEEALTNVVKHSRARRVQLQLSQPDADHLHLRIEDDGVGFDVAAVRKAGVSVGMRSMHTRIARVHGTLDIASAPGCTVLTAVLQLRPAAAQPV